jgi:hypothetical protein
MEAIFPTYENVVRRMLILPGISRVKQEFDRSIAVMGGLRIHESSWEARPELSRQ